MSAIRSNATPNPIIDINMTPLIDVLLVLLIMFILVIPAVTHKVQIDLPTGQVETTSAPPPVRQLNITASGGLVWDGTPISASELPNRLNAMVANPDNPVLRVQTDGAAPYNDVDHYLAAIARAGVDQLGFVGNHQFADAF